MTSTHTPVDTHPNSLCDPYSSPVLFIISYLCFFFSFPILVCKYTCHRTCEPKVCTTLTFFFFHFLFLEKKFKTRKTQKIEVPSIFCFLDVWGNKKEKAHLWFTLGPVFNTALSY